MLSSIIPYTVVIPNIGKEQEKLRLLHYIKTIENLYIKPLLELETEKEIDEFTSNIFYEFLNLRYNLILEFFKFMDCDLEKMQQLMGVALSTLSEIENDDLKESTIILSDAVRILLKYDLDNIDIEKNIDFLNGILTKKSALIDFYLCGIAIGKEHKNIMPIITSKLKKEVKEYHTQIRKFYIEQETGLEVSIYKGRLLLTEEHTSRMENLTF